MQTYFEQEVDTSHFFKQRVAVIGYGSHGHSHALNLRDSGVAVTVGLRAGSPSWPVAEEAGFAVRAIAEAASGADVVMMLVPDEDHASVYREHVHPYLRPGAALGFAHGFSIHYGQVQPRLDCDVFMVAPKGTGVGLRAAYLAGSGVPALLAVHQDYSGQAKKIALAYGVGIGSGRVGMLDTTFREETETDLFGEQAVLCGGLISLLQGAFETLVDAGYQAEVAYFECMHELKLIVDLLYAGGITRLNEAISNNAEYGKCVSGSVLITEQSREAMRGILQRIQSGAYARDFILEKQAGFPQLQRRRELDRLHPIEVVGSAVRKMMERR